jgi:hypothetical protein
LQAGLRSEGAAAEHYVRFGFTEGRTKDSFDGFQYIASYNDLISAGLRSESSAAAHYVQSGFAEDRARDAFNGFQYLASYSDLLEAGLRTETWAAIHFIQNGFQRDGREMLSTASSISLPIPICSLRACAQKTRRQSTSF